MLLIVEVRILSPIVSFALCFKSNRVAGLCVIQSHGGCVCWQSRTLPKSSHGHARLNVTLMPCPREVLVWRNESFMSVLSCPERRLYAHTGL